mgnify:CR=1 FL=1
MTLNMQTNLSFSSDSEVTASLKSRYAEAKELSNLLLKTRIKNEIEKGRILEAKAKAKLGELIPVEEVRKNNINRMQIIRKSLMVIPDKVAFQITSADEANRVHEVLLREINIVLEV